MIISLYHLGGNEWSDTSSSTAGQSMAGQAGAGQGDKKSCRAPGPRTHEQEHGQHGPPLRSAVPAGAQWGRSVSQITLAGLAGR